MWQIGQFLFEECHALLDACTHSYHSFSKRILTCMT
jgi:hypothetical protein